MLSHRKDEHSYLNNSLINCSFPQPGTDYSPQVSFTLLPLLRDPVEPLLEKGHWDKRTFALFQWDPSIVNPIVSQCTDNQLQPTTNVIQLRPAKMQGHHIWDIQGQNSTEIAGGMDTGCSQIFNSPIRQSVLKFCSALVQLE